MHYQVGRSRGEDREHGFHYSQILPGRRSVPLPPRFVFGDFPGKLTDFYFSATEVWPVGLYEVDDVTVSGPGLLSRGECSFYVDETNTHMRAFVGHAARHGLALPIFSPQVVEASDVVILAGPGHTVFGHWLVDFLPKLYVLHQAGLDHRKLRYLLPADTPRYAIELLNVVGIPDTSILFYNSREGCYLKRAIVPTLLRTNSRTSDVFRDAVLYFNRQIDYVITNDRKHRPKNLFISRSSWQNPSRTLSNRSQIEALATSSGFELYAPEAHHIFEQIRTFRNANCVAGEYGSALHSTIFCPRLTPVCVFRWTNTDPGFLQSGIAESLQQPTGYVFGSSTDDGSFSIDPSLARRGLDFVRQMSDL